MLLPSTCTISMSHTVERVLRGCLKELPGATRAQLVDIEHKLLANAAAIDLTEPANPVTALYHLIVQQTSLRTNVKEFSELQQLVADVCDAASARELNSRRIG